MLILAVIAMDLAAISIWSATYGVNGFKELGKLVKGEPSFTTPGPERPDSDRPAGQNIPEEGTPEFLAYINEQRRLKGLPPVVTPQAAQAWWEAFLFGNTLTGGQTNPFNDGDFVKDRLR